MSEVQEVGGGGSGILESGCHGLNSKDEETETAGTGGEYTDMPGLS